MNPTWNIKDTENHILRIYGEKQKTLIHHSLQSIELKTSYAAYHYHEAENIFANFIQEESKTKHPIRLITEDTQENDECRIMVEANFLGCLSNMHAIPDTFAHIIYYGFGLNLDDKPKLKERLINASRVLTKIESLEELKAVYALLKDINENDRFKHLSAIVNHSKHRYVKRLGWVPLDNGTNKISIPAYRYDNCNYQEIGFKEFIEPEFNRISKLTLELGNAINQVLVTR